MLMSEKLSDDNFMVFSNKIQISMVKSLLEPMLRPRGRGGRGFRMRSSATLRHLERPLVFARGTMAENYHLKQKKGKKKLEPKAKQALISSRILSLLTSFLLRRLLLRLASAATAAATAPSRKNTSSSSICFQLLQMYFAKVSLSARLI